MEEDSIWNPQAYTLNWFRRMVRILISDYSENNFAAVSSRSPFSKRGHPELRTLLGIPTNLCVSVQISALIREFEDGAVVAEGTSGAEAAHGGEDVAEGRLAGGGGFQALIAEKLARRVFRLGDPVGDEHEAVAWFHLPAPAGVVHIRQQAYGHVGFEHARYRPGGDQHRRHMAAVDELQLAVGFQVRDHQRSVLFAQRFLAEEVVD